MPLSHHLISALFFALATIASVGCAHALELDVSAKPPLIYKTVGGRSLRIDWDAPADWKPTDQRSSVTFFHGGGWVGGVPGQFKSHSVALANRGIVCFRVEYRLLGRKNSGGPDEAIADVSDAFRYLRGQAEKLGLDPNRMAAGGGSAGGHLAAYLGMMDDQRIGGISRKPNALCLFNPVYDNGPGQWGHQRVGDRYREYSPAEHITADDPPTWVVLGTEDNLIPVATAERFRDRMEALGVRSELHLYSGRGHGFFNVSSRQNYEATLESMIAFLSSLQW